MVMLIVVGGAILTLLATVFIIRQKGYWNEVLSRFKRGNVIVFGRKGCGKDLLFDSVIKDRRKAYISNISYGRKGRIEGLETLSVEPNTYTQFIEGNVQKIERDDSKEGIDYYISDGGVYLPSQYSAKLDKEYPSMPIYYALSRHLYNSNVHINTQALGRIWNKLREQGDTYIQALRTYKIGFVLIIHYRVYDKYSSAENEVRPYKAGFLPKREVKAALEEHKATYGVVFEGWKLRRKGTIKYDTRHFKGVLFEEKVSENEGKKTANNK